MHLVTLQRLQLLIVLGKVVLKLFPGAHIHTPGLYNKNSVLVVSKF